MVPLRRTLPALAALGLSACQTVYEPELPPLALASDQCIMAGVVPERPSAWRDCLRVATTINRQAIPPFGPASFPVRVPDSFEPSWPVYTVCTNLRDTVSCRTSN